jgi:hypothetical protein
MTKLSRRVRNVPASGLTHWPILEAIQKLEIATYKDLGVFTGNCKETLQIRVEDLIGSNLLVRHQPRVNRDRTLRFKLTEQGKAITNAESLDQAFRKARGEGSFWGNAS